jgi:hypothetical protein
MNIGNLRRPHPDDREGRGSTLVRRKFSRELEFRIKGCGERVKECMAYGYAMIYLGYTYGNLIC